MQVRSLSQFCKYVSEAIEKDAFAFFLGAGCSITSNVPSASHIALRWVMEMKREETGVSSGFEAWYGERNPGFSREKAGAFYSHIIRERYPNPAQRRAAVQDFVSCADPGVGYALLSEMLTNSKTSANCNVVLTTNFDDLVADALFLFKKVKALVIPHDDLVAHSVPTMRCPLIVKVHGDANLAPRSTAEEIASLSKEMSAALHRILYGRGIVFLGYSGYDQSVAKALSKLPKEAISNGIYWINKNPPGDEELFRCLTEREAVWVKHNDFDELMMSLHSKLELPKPEGRRFKDIVNNYESAFATVARRIGLSGANLPPSKSSVEANLKQLIDEFRRSSGDISAIDSLVERRLALYRKSPDLLGICAQYMRRHSLREAAEILYQKALELDPDHPNVLCNYAGFVLDQAANGRKDVYDQAEKLLLLACSANPTNSQCMGAMASFYAERRKDVKRAQIYYDRALAIGHDDPETLASYANFLWRAEGHKEDAIEYYEQSLGLNPSSFRTLANFSQLLFLEESRTSRIRARGYALSVAEKSDNRILQLEVLFYLFAHHPKDADAEYLKKIKPLIDDGIRSPDWDLSPTVRCAERLGHVHRHLVQALGDVISKLSDPARLREFDAWNRLSG